MNGELALLVALAAHGNAWLAGPVDEAPELFPASPIFRWVHDVRFRRARLLRAFHASSCRPWYHDLRRRGVRSLRLVREKQIPRNPLLEPHIAAGFSGGLDVGILAEFALGEPELWVAEWSVAAPQHPERRIWSVTLESRSTSVPVASDSGVADVAQRLGYALDDAAAFADAHEHLTDWVAVFRKARTLLSVPDPQIPYFHDLVPAGHPVAARQLLAAASAGWVFGGMGSWNDVATSGDAGRYRAVSVELFEAIMQATLAGANASRDAH